MGRHRLGALAVSLYHDRPRNVVVSLLHGEPGEGAVVQAWKWLSLRQAEVKKPDIPALLLLASGCNAFLAFQTSNATRNQAERVEKPRAGAKAIREVVSKLENELEGAKSEYRRWRGVLDLDVANDHLRDRNEEVWDLNQKILGTVQAPHIIHKPWNYIVSAWQQTDRMRLKEMKSQAKDQQAKLRQRIDFSHRWRIQELERRCREARALLEDERKKDLRQGERIQALADSSDAVQLTVLVCSTPRYMTGRRGRAIEAAAKQAHEDAARFQAQAQRQLRLRFAASPPLLWLPDASSLARLPVEGAQELASKWQAAWALVPSEPLQKSLDDALSRLLDKPTEAMPDLSRFPSIQDAKRRLAYLGLALAPSGTRAATPLLFDLDEQGPRHTAVVGGSGSGKSIAARLITEGAALQGVPVVAFDPTRAWTGLAEPCTQKAFLDRYPDFHLSPEWARGFPVRITDGTDSGLDHLLEGVTVLSADHLAGKEEAQAVGRLLKDLYAQMKTWPESKRLRLLLVLEEAHRYLKDKTLEPILELFARTARAKGVGLLVVSQVAVDLPPAIRSNCATKIQLQTNYAQDLTRVAQVYGSDYKATVAGLNQGQGLIHYPEYGTALAAFRPPLHSPTAVSETLARLHAAGRDLKEAVEMLVATSDATATGDINPPEDVSTEAQEALAGEATRFDATDWRSVATRLIAKGKPTAREIQQAIRKKGLYSPSIRTIQRFMRQTHPDSDDS